MTEHSQTFGQRLKKRRIYLKLTVEQLSEAVGMTRQYISALERDDYSKNLPLFTVKKLAEALKISVDFLCYGEQYKNAENFDKVNRFVPVLQWDEVAPWLIEGFNMQFNRQVEYVSVDDDKPSSCFCLTIRNDSMEACNNERVSFKEGERIIVDPTVPPENGKFVIFSNGNSEPILRQLIIEGDKFYLKPLNKRYPIQEVDIHDSKIKFHGVVSEIRIVV